MRLAVLVSISISISSSAFAQPGAPLPPPPPHHYVPGAHYPVQLSAEEHELLLDGEITDGQHFGGVVANIFIGYGTGQAIQGRWSDTGWIFTLGEGASAALIIYGIVKIFEDCHPQALDGDCDDDDGTVPLVAGLIGGTVFRTWSIIDAASGPGDHNRRVRALRYRLGIPVQVAPYVAPASNDGATAGIALRF